MFQRGGEPFLYENGTASKVFRNPWKDACEKAPCPGGIPHDFRRTAVRNPVGAGVPGKSAMLLTGQKTRSVFDRYDVVNEADLWVAVGRLAETGTKKGESSETARAARFHTAANGLT